MPYVDIMVVKQRSSNLVRIVLRDGAIYYIFQFTISLTNMLLFLILNEQCTILLAQLLCTLHAILTCRVILHICEEAWNQTHLISDTTLDHLDLEIKQTTSHRIVHDTLPSSVKLLCERLEQYICPASLVTPSPSFLDLGASSSTRKDGLIGSASTAKQQWATYWTTAPTTLFFYKPRSVILWRLWKVTGGCVGEGCATIASSMCTSILFESPCILQWC
ncbi:hypothetical protein BDQ17DRAFT_1335253 [Cyathus striatus]|nr:hypothetical protein BDQ17DRAFT_1335253 [Cyathus striatus]